MSIIRVAVLLVLLLTLPVAAQDDAVPTVAILNFGISPAYELVDDAILNVLQGYAFISEEEREALANRSDLEGEHVNILWGDAAFDYANIGPILDDAIDNGADILVTYGAALTLRAVNASSDMDEPLPVLFTSVHNPYEAGIAASSCDKPDHVTGTETVTDYGLVFDALATQDPDLQAIGTLFDTASAAGAYGAEQIASIAEERGLRVEEAGIVAIADVAAATESLISKGAQAIVLTQDFITSSSLPIIVGIGNDNGVPVFHPAMGSIFLGATIGVGYSNYSENGNKAGIMLAAYLNDELDIANTGINVHSGSLLGINLDSAAEQGIEVSPELIEASVAVIEGGNAIKLSPFVMQVLASRNIVIPAERRAEADAAWLASLQCEDE